MKSNIFELEFDKEKGTLTSLIIAADKERANFIKEGRGLFEIHDTPWYDKRDHLSFGKLQEKWELSDFSDSDNTTIACFERRGVTVAQTFINTENDLRVKIDIKNNNFYPVYFQEDSISIYTPFSDSYDDSLTCQTVRCHAHMAAFGENSYVRTERMGLSEHNVGVLFLKGSAISYSQENCDNSNDRGYLVMNIEPFSLLKDQTYSIEIAVFTHSGGDDFFTKARQYKEYVYTRADKGYVLFKGESGSWVLTAYDVIENAVVRCGGKKLPFEVHKNEVTVHLNWNTCGEKKITYEVNGRRGWAYFYVSLPFDDLRQKRASFIIRNQQCLDKASPLYGAFLIYDNEEKRQYFSYEFTDHNANRERMCIPLFLVKYMRKTGDKTVRKRLELFNEFLFRESLDEDTGRSYNNIGKDASRKRLYNAPWVILYFCELYMYDGNPRWINLAYKMIVAYYENGGTTFYPNGIRFSELRRAFEKYGDREMYENLLSMFDKHISELVRKGTDYPPHEVNYEQTIVTPAACLMLDKYLVCKDQKYIFEAEKHLKLLIKFNGCQPDYRLNKVPIRYWDNYWFGKLRSCVYGDTLPQPSVAHSAHCFYSYGVITNDQKWIEYGLSEWRSGLCLFNGKGEAHSSFVYPERVNGEKGQFLDPFANEQDGFLYLAYKIDEEL